MRVPHTISGNVLKVYEASDETVGLVNELNRRLRAEDLQWDAALAPSLIAVCIKAIVDNFKEKQMLNELPDEDRDLLYETLPTDLPLTLTVPLITADVYWQRCAAARWTSGNYVKDYGDSWQRLYMERHVQDHLETLSFNAYETAPLVALVSLCSPHVRRLKLRQLQACEEEEGGEGEDECTVEERRVDHINLLPVLKGLQYLQVLDLMFGVRECGMDFAWNLFQFSISDCKQLGLGIEQCKHLVTFRLHRSSLDDTRLIMLLQYIARNRTLKELDFTHCRITDLGALALGKVLTTHPTLSDVNLANNKIGSKGAAGLAFALMHSASPLDSLNLRLNVIGSAGAVELCSALAKCGRPRRLVLGGCGITAAAAVPLGNALKNNVALQWLDLSSNDLGELGGTALHMAMETNRTMLYLDVRRTGINPEHATLIGEALKRNNQPKKAKVSSKSSADGLSTASRGTSLRMSSYTIASGKAV